MRLSLLFAALIALPLCGAARAETPLTAEEFDSYSQGKTLTYAMGGEVFGTEQYLPNRRVRWAFTQDVCKIGSWYEEAGLICFVYEDEGAPQCWKFWREGEGLKGQFEGDPEGTELSEVAQTDKPLLCAGPDVGV